MELEEFENKLKDNDYLIQNWEEYEGNLKLRVAIINLKSYVRYGTDKIIAFIHHSSIKPIDCFAKYYPTFEEGVFLMKSNECVKVAHNNQLYNLEEFLKIIKLQAFS